MHFKARIGEKLADVKLQAALRKLQSNFVKGRAERVLELDNFEEIRTAAAAIRDRALNNLDAYLEAFERNAQARGAVVHWAETAADVNRIVCELAAEYQVRKVVKSKSMVSEECNLNDALEAAGIEVIETDLGEYILQLAHEPPSHIVAPVVHKSRDEVSDLFHEKHGKPRKTGIAELCREARETLRPHFLSAGMGISGANFIIAETGSTLIVTNEGNGRMVTTLPRVHVAITGIEKVVPTLEDVTTLLRLLPRHATGQSITNYISVTTGVAQPGEAGPKAGEQSWRKWDLSTSRSVSRMTLLGKPEAKKRRGSSRCTDIRSWQANLEVPSPVQIALTLRWRATEKMLHIFSAPRRHVSPLR